MPKNGQGSASPFVEVSFDGQRHRTKTVAQDLNPTWNETLVFNVADASALQEKTIEVVVLNERSGGAAAHRNFLGRVRISGAAVAASSAAAAACCCPLDKRGIFSNIRGDITLRVYAAPDPPSETPSHSSNEAKSSENYQKPAPEKKPKDRHHSHSIPVNGGSSGLGFNAAKAHQPAPEKRSDFSRAPPLGFGLVETWPTLAARMGFRSDKISSTYDLVEQMQYLYVKVVKARDLPANDSEKTMPSSHVEVKLGNYKGLTKPVEKTQNPNWSQVFAFSKERLQSHLLEVSVKEKDQVFGRMAFDLAEVPLRVPPDSPLAPQWYRLEDNKGRKLQRGEIMLAVWMGTQADEAFPDAWHSDAHSVNSDFISQTRSKVYFSPRLCYLRVRVIEAQDVGPASAPHVKIQLSNQLRRTRQAVNSAWNEELLFVAAEPYDEPLVVTVEDKDAILGRLVMPVESSFKRLDHKKLPPARWFSLEKPPGKEDEEKSKKFSGKIHLRVSLDAGYHVLDESAQYCSDLLPAARNLWKPSIGILELGILGARNLAPLNPYCVAKFGPKWVRTRTLVNTGSPRWNEQYTWEVHDPCTVLTVGVFDNGAAGDQRIGKVRIRLSTLETDRLYTHFYPLLALNPSGLKKAGELHLAVRFTCTSWVNMITLYGDPLLPKMHYTEPISVAQLNYLRHQAVQMVGARLARAEPPLRREVVECMLDVDAHMFSLRRSKANFYRITALLSGAVGVTRWLETVCEWGNPGTTVLVHVLFLVLIWYPELILPTFFLYLFLVGIWNFRLRPRNPVSMDAKLSQAEWALADEIDEELDTFPSSRPNEVVRMRYDRLRSVAGRLQTVAGDLATQGERAHALLSWRDPRATAIAVFLVLFLALVLYSVPFQVLATLGVMYLLRHPRFRSRMPSVVFNFYRRLPAKSDVLL